MFTEAFNLMRVIYYGVPALIIIIMLIILVVSSRKDKNTQIQKAGDHADQDQKMYIGEEQKQWGFIGAAESEKSDTL